MVTVYLILIFDICYISLHKQWKESNFEHIRPKSYIFLVEPNPIKESLLKERGIIPIVSVNEEPGIALTNFLRDLIHSI